MGELLKLSFYKKGKCWWVQRSSAIESIDSSNKQNQKLSEFKCKLKTRSVSRSSLLKIHAKVLKYYIMLFNIASRMTPEKRHTPSLRDQERPYKKSYCSSNGHIYTNFW